MIFGGIQMNEQGLSKRLAKVGSYVQTGARLADIGSDHAYLPVALMLQNKIQYAVAGEVVKGPYQSAEKQVRKNGLIDKVIVRLADGLTAIHSEDQIDTITICGMGGTLIVNILEKGKELGNLSHRERLILQPNVGEKTVREWLSLNKYRILNEEILEENQKIYEIIVAEPTTSKEELSEEHLFFGPKLMEEKSDVFKKKWHHELKEKKRILNELKKAGNPPVEKLEAFERQIKWIEEML